jgi:hypothetical protein
MDSGTCTRIVHKDEETRSGHCEEIAVVRIVWLDVSLADDFACEGHREDAEEELQAGRATLVELVAE